MIATKKSHHEPAKKPSSLLENLQREHGYCYFQNCVKELPCIDWFDFAAKMYRRNGKFRTAMISAAAFWRLHNSFDKGDLCVLLTEIKMQASSPDGKNQASQAAIKLIDDFVGHCVDETDLSNGSIKLYTTCIKRVLKYAGVKIDKDDFNDKVIMPKTVATLEEFPTNEQIIRILNCCSPRVRLFVSLLCDTGLGRSEVVRLRPKDFDFGKDPIIVRAYRVKTGEPIETICTRVTAELVQQYVRKKSKGPDYYIFVNRNKIDGALNRIAYMYGQALKAAGLDQKLEVRNGDRIQKHKFFKFHMHVYRKRWFTKAIMAGVPDYVAHAMLGRKQYLSQYLAVPPEEKHTLFKKIAKLVSVYETKADKAEVMAEASKILGIELTEEKLAALKETLQWAVKMQPKNKELFKPDKED